MFSGPNPGSAPEGVGSGGQIDTQNQQMMMPKDGQCLTFSSIAKTEAEKKNSAGTDVLVNTENRQLNDWMMRKRQEKSITRTTDQSGPPASGHAGARRSFHCYGQ